VHCSMPCAAACACVISELTCGLCIADPSTSQPVSFKPAAAPTIAPVTAPVAMAVDLEDDDLDMADSPKDVPAEALEDDGMIEADSVEYWTEKRAVERRLARAAHKLQEAEAACLAEALGAGLHAHAGVSTDDDESKVALEVKELEVMEDENGMPVANGGACAPMSAPESWALPCCECLVSLQNVGGWLSVVLVSANHFAYRAMHDVWQLYSVV
jgi:hypothetical protein